ncbi:hypothetical protein AKO1_006248 [Acrasis kona]|uniref:non-specific serine/threonine protein kinase n=1 Tax=Acrasis kona TaxID=1008807 RepID=A0AAW2YJV5_9EUKA
MSITKTLHRVESYTSQCVLFNLLSVIIMNCNLKSRLKLLDGFISDGTLDKCSSLIINQPNLGSQRIEGTGYGFPDVGLLDGMINFYNTFVTSLNQDQVRQFYNNSTAWASICTMMKSLNNNSEISIEGISFCLQFIYSSMCFCESFRDNVMKDRLLLRTITLHIKSDFVKQLLSWPISRGGGQYAVEHVVQKALTILIMILNFQGDCSALIFDIMYKEEVTKHCIYGMTLVDGCDGFVALLSKLITCHSRFAAHVIKFDGFNNALVDSMLGHENVDVVLDYLQIATQLARSSKGYYNNIGATDICVHIKNLIVNKDCRIRSRTCSLIGNMCRHSNYFYEIFLKCNIIPELINRCHDPDQSTRKFACFAIGNACFHSSILLRALKDSVAPLVALLGDEEEKTRANAAGAIGNLVRKSDELVPDLIEQSALIGLMKCLNNRDASTKIALFSLGNCCSYKECRDALKDKDLLSEVKKMKSEPSTDPTIKKYAHRIFIAYET